MREYLVLFHTVVPGPPGLDLRILRRRTLVSARSEIAAAYAAKAMFSAAAGIADWRMRADTCEVIELPPAWRDTTQRRGEAIRQPAGIPEAARAASA